MAWWDFGIRARDDDGSMVASKGVSYPVTGYPNLDSFIPCGSVALHNAAEQGETYRQLLITTGGGTQIYAELTCTFAGYQAMYLPNENVYVKKFSMRLIIRKNGADVWSSTAGSSVAFCEIASSNSIYDYCMRATGSIYNDAGRVNNLQMVYPNTKNSGNVNQLAMTSSSSGLSFWVTGFSCVYIDGSVYTCPASELITIPSSVLNNREWFDPDNDQIPQDEYNNTIGSGGANFPVDYNYPGDDIDFPSLPSGASAIGFGRMHIYHPTSAQLGSALDILWSDSDETTLETIIESCKKWWYKPEQYCVALMLMPLDISGVSDRIFFGKYDTQTNAAAIASQWQTVDCGSINIPLKSGSAFDFAPYSKAMIFLPYVGFRPINVNEIMGGSIAIKYYIDMFTGSAMCFVKVSGQNSNSSVLYNYECNVAQQVPITSENYNQVINSLISTSVAVMTAPSGLGSLGNLSSGVAGGIVNAAGNLGAPDIQTSGKLNSNTGALGNANPYVVLHFPVQSLPSGFASQNGFPSAVNVRLSTLSGYTEIEQIHLDISNITEEELTELERKLREGVIL